MSESITLSEICISASSKAWEGEGEILATGIGLIPRIAAGLAKLTHNPDLMMTDGETYLISQPAPMGKSCLLYTSPSPRDVEESRMPSSA